jgi:hypothetical protein
MDAPKSSRTHPTEEGPSELNRRQVIVYSILIILSIAIFIYMLIGADPLTLLISFGISIFFIYFLNKDTEENETNLS